MGSPITKSLPLRSSFICRIGQGGGFERSANEPKGISGAISRGSCSNHGKSVRIVIGNLRMETQIPAFCIRHRDRWHPVQAPFTSMSSLWRSQKTSCDPKWRLDGLAVDRTVLEMLLVADIVCFGFVCATRSLIRSLTAPPSPTLWIGVRVTSRLVNTERSHEQHDASPNSLS